MGVGLGLMGVGMILQAYGQDKANQDQARAEAKNARFLRRQQEFMRDSLERDLVLFDREEAIIHGEQQSAFAKAGVDAESAAVFFAEQKEFAAQERASIRENADLNIELAGLRAQQSEQTAKSLSSTRNRVLNYASAGASFGGQALI